MERMKLYIHADQHMGFSGLGPALRQALCSGRAWCAAHADTSRMGNEHRQFDPGLMVSVS